MKKMKGKSFFAMLLCLAIVASTLSGCGAKKGEQTGEVNDSQGNQETKLSHMDISLAFWDVDVKLGSRETDTLLQTIEDKFNVTFVPYNITWDDYREKVNLWASSDSLPDIFVGDLRYSSTFFEFAREGLLKAIPEDLSAYPNLEQYINSESALKASCMVDGEMYCIYRKTWPDTASSVLDNFIFYRWDLAQAAGVKEKPTNWQEFRDMMQAIMKADPENKNVKGATGAEVFINPFFSYSMPLATIGGINFKWVDNGDGTYVPAYFAGENLGDDALATWNLLRDMYQEGTIDTDITLMTLDQGISRFLNGQNAALMTAGMEYIWTNMFAYWDEVNDTPAEEAIGILDLMPDQEGNTYYTAETMAWSESYFSAKVDDEKLDRILMIYDYLASEEGVILGAYGFEGETYTVDSDNKVTVADDFYTKYPSAEIFNALVAWNGNIPTKYEKVSQYPDWINEIQDARVEAASQIDMPEAVEECTSIYISLAPKMELNLTDDLNRIITGTRPVEEMWNEIIEEYKEEGLEEYIQQVNEMMK